MATTLEQDDIMAKWLGLPAQGQMPPLVRGSGGAGVSVGIRPVGARNTEQIFHDAEAVTDADMQFRTSRANTGPAGDTQRQVWRPTDRIHNPLPNGGDLPRVDGGTNRLGFVSNTTNTTTNPMGPQRQGGARDGKSLDQTLKDTIWGNISGGGYFTPVVEGAEAAAGEIRQNYDASMPPKAAPAPDGTPVPMPGSRAVGGERVNLPFRGESTDLLGAAGVDPMARSGLPAADRLGELRKMYEDRLAAGMGTGVFVSGVRKDGMRDTARSGFSDVQDTRRGSEKRGYVNPITGKYEGERTAGVKGVHKEMVPVTKIDPKTGEEVTTYQEKWKKDRPYNTGDSLGSMHAFIKELDSSGDTEAAKMLREQVLPRYITKSAQDHVAKLAEGRGGIAKAATKVGEIAADPSRIPRPVMKTFEQMAREEASSLALKRMGEMQARKDAGKGGLLNTAAIKRAQEVERKTYGMSLEEKKMKYANDLQVALKEQELAIAKVQAEGGVNQQKALGESRAKEAEVTGAYGLAQRIESGNKLLEKERIAANGQIQASVARQNVIESYNLSRALQSADAATRTRAAADKQKQDGLITATFGPMQTPDGKPNAVASLMQQVPAETLQSIDGYALRLSKSGLSAKEQSDRLTAYAIKAVPELKDALENM